MPDAPAAAPAAASDLRPDLHRAAQLFAAAFGALCIAVMLGLHNPFWAAMPVWVVHQAFREDLVTRGILRIIGTLAGAGVGLATLHWAPGPEWMALALGLTIAAAASASRWIGNVYSYGPLMAAITCGVVIAPAIAIHADAMAAAVDRVWCTLIGVGAVTLCTFPFTPKREGPPPPRHRVRYWRTAAPRGAVAGLIAGLAALVAAELGGFGAMSATLSLAVFGSLLAGMSNPAPVLKWLLPGAAIGVAAAFAYRGIGAMIDPAAGGGVLPHLLLAGVFIAAGALARCTPRLAPFGLDANMCFLLAAEVGAGGRPLLLVAEGGALMLLAAAAMTAFWKTIFRPTVPL